MPIDTSIISRIQAAPIKYQDPSEAMQRGLTLKALMGQGEVQQLQTDALRRADTDDKAVRDAFTQSGGDSKILRQLLNQGGQYKAVQALDASDLARREKESVIGKNEAQGGKAKFEQEMDKLSRGAAILETAKDQASYDAALRMGTIAGIFSPEAIAKFPPQFTPEGVAALRNAGITRAQQLEQEHRQATLTETGRHNLVTEGTTAANNPFKADGTPNLPVQTFQLDKAKKGATNVEVKTDVKTGESLGQQVGPMMKDSVAIAEGAAKQVDAAQRIVKAVDSGNMLSGPLANARMTVAQVSQMMGIGGKDEAEKIANTRAAIRGLAELTLQGRQQMKGQGAITESEGLLAQRAMSGDVNDLTAAEVRQLARASERAARYNHAEHVRKLTVMQQNPNLSGIAPFYQGPAMPAEIPDAPAKPVPAKPTAGSVRASNLSNKELLEEINR